MKNAVIYWSGTGNTEMMAKAIAEGAGADLFTVSEFSGNVADYDRIAFGCAAMGAEVLEEDEFEPFFSSIEGSLSGKTVALFDSYGWGDGEWMRNWEERVKADGTVLFADAGLIVNETPSDRFMLSAIQRKIGVFQLFCINMQNLRQSLELDLNQYKSENNRYLFSDLFFLWIASQKDFF